MSNEIEQSKIRRAKIKVSTWLDGTEELAWRVMKITIVIFTINWLVMQVFRYDARRVVIREYEIASDACGTRLIGVTRVQLFSTELPNIKFICLD